MHATAILLAIGIAATAQQAPARQPAEGETRVCGEVKTQRTSPPACDAIMRIGWAGEEFDVVIPAAVGRELSVAPARLRGADVCFTGALSTADGVKRLNVTSRAGVEVISVVLDANFGAEAAFPCGNNVTMPQVLKEQKPHYSYEAMRQKVQGTVEMQALVDKDGAVSEARVVRSVHPDLDEEALKAVKAWRFVPGTVDGKPAPVLVEIEMSFAVSSRR